MRTRFAFVVLAAVSFVACKPATHSAYAVGTYLGSDHCTYEAAPSVVDHSGPGSVKLIGEGTVTETCGDTKEVIDVLHPTALRIDGPAHIKAGATPGISDNFNIIALAGSRELSGVTKGAVVPEWSLAEDCPAGTTFGPVYGSQDTGGPDIFRTVVASKAGPCTLRVTVLGLSTSRKITID